jgi:rhodanese-related sulfurtransferase
MIEETMNTRKFFRLNLVGFILGMLVASVACAPTPAPFNMQTTLDKYVSGLPDDWGIITPTALNDQIKTQAPFLVDVRETKEVADAGFIAGAINIPIRTFIKNLDKLPAKDQPIVVTCGSGHRSAIAMAALQLLGYTNVKSMSGGLAAWKAANLPVATGTPPGAKAGQAPEVNQDLFPFARSKTFAFQANSFSTGSGVILPL